MFSNPEELDSLIDVLMYQNNPKNDQLDSLICRFIGMAEKLEKKTAGAVSNDQ